MRRHVCSLFLTGILCSALVALPAAAQEGKGSITGTVKDSGSGVLKGALVELQPSEKRAVSDDQGQFRITDVAAGKYTLTASYVGLANFTATVTVAAGQPASVDAVLKVAGVTDQVVVTVVRLPG